MATSTETKRPRKIASEVAGTTLTLTYLGQGALTLDASTLSQEIRDAAMMHGLRQKLSDGAAKSDATDAEKFANMSAIRDSLIAGGWSQRAAGDGEGATPGLIARAYEQFVVAQYAKSGKLAGKPAPSLERIREVYSGMEQKAKLALRTVPEIASIMDTMRAAKSPSINPDDLLASFKG